MTIFNKKYIWKSVYHNLYIVQFYVFRNIIAVLKHPFFLQQILCAMLFDVFCESTQLVHLSNMILSVILNIFVFIVRSISDIK